MMKLSKKQLNIMQHTLGLNEYGKDSSGGDKGYRNHFVAGQGHHDFDDLLVLVDAGYMVQHKAMEISGGSPWFSVTEAGREAVKLESPKPPKLSRAKQRYKRFREYGDCFDSFLEFCRWDADPERSWNQAKKATA